MERAPDNSLWARSGIGYSLWTRYLEVFDAVQVVTRVRAITQPPPDSRRVDGPQVTVFDLPFFAGPWQYMVRRRALRAALPPALDPTDAVLLRVPGIISGHVARLLRPARRPYAVEVVGDPYDMFGPGGVRSVARPFMRYLIPRQLRRHCAGASAALYVTEEALQRRYPPAPTAYAVGCSDVELTDESFVAGPRPVPPNQRQFNLIFVGGLSQLYKAPDVLIAAVAANVRSGLDLRLTFAGGGQYQPVLEQLARRLGVHERVRFAGLLPGGEAVRAELDQADLFVLPSRQEGLPRALVEAMARGLPCIASTVGGIPELLQPEDMVPPGDVEALATKIREVLASRERLAQMAARNLKHARDYHADILRARRRAFFEAVRDRTLEWQRRKRVSIEHAD
jgi:glycosyltransferase involved in cell wall biosynthesis